MSNNLKGVIAQYKKINNLTEEECMLPEHQQVIQNALVDVWQYSGLFDNETEELKDKRLKMSGPKNGEVSDLAKHFRQLYPRELKGLMGYSVVFWVYNRMNALKSAVTTGSSTNVSDKDTVTVEETEGISILENSAENGASDITNNNRKNEKEDMIMSQVAQEQLNALTEQLNGEQQEPASSEPISNSNTKPKDDGIAKPNNDNMTKAANKIVEQNKQERELNSQNVKITKVIFAKRPLEERLVDGEKAKGVIKADKIASVLANFEKKFGVSEEDGTVKFLYAVDQEEARKVYEALLSAQTDPSKEFDVYCGNGSGTFRGVRRTDAENKEIIENKDNLLKFILTKTAAYINTTKEGVQFRTRSIRETKLAKSDEKLEKLQKEHKKISLQDVVMLQIVGRKDLVDDKKMIEYVTEKDVDVKSTQAGAKSNLSAKYFAREGDAFKMSEKYKDKKIERTYRIPLEAEMYGEKAVKELSDAFPDRSANKTVDYRENGTDLNKELSEMLLRCAQWDLDGDLFAQLRNEANAQEKSDIKNQAAAMGF